VINQQPLPDRAISQAKTIDRQSPMDRRSRLNCFHEFAREL